MEEGADTTGQGSSVQRPCGIFEKTERRLICLQSIKGGAGCGSNITREGSNHQTAQGLLGHFEDLNMHPLRNGQQRRVC